MPKYGLLLFLFASVAVHGFAQQPGNTGTGKGTLWIGAMAGPGLLIEKAPDSLIPELRDFANELRSGWHYGFETEYFFNKYVGIGAKYVRFNTSQEVDSLVIEIFSNIYYFDLSSSMNIHSLSPMVYGKLPLFNDKLTVTGGLGPAWLFYRNLGKVVGDTTMLRGSSPGLATTLRASCNILSGLSIGLQGNYTRAFLKEFTKDDGSSQQVVKLEKENYQNLSRIDLSLVLMYTFRFK
jgi:hypothetical protein